MISQKRILILKVGQIEKTEELFKGSSFEKLVYEANEIFQIFVVGYDVDQLATSEVIHR